MKAHRTRLAIIVLTLGGCAAPSKAGKPREEMTERERDSTLAASGLPGAGVVRKGLSMSDAQAKRAAAEDSASREN
jgi:hypothetical protein